MPKPSAFDRELQALSAQLKKVEAEYTMYFSGRNGRPPIESRAALDRAFKRFDRMPFESPVARFQFTTLQARYSSFSDLWDRGVRAREEGRGGPFVRSSPPAAAPVESDQLLHAAVFRDPLQEMDKLRELYEALMQARRDEGHPVVPFHRFAGLVRDQVKTLLERHPGDEIRFLVTRHEGKVNLTARAERAVPGDGDGEG
jgi:hypothetical protein